MAIFKSRRFLFPSMMHLRIKMIHKQKKRMKAAPLITKGMMHLR